MASSEALDLLYRAMCAVLYRRTAAAIKTASFLGEVYVLIVVCLPVALAAAGAIWSK